MRKMNAEEIKQRIKGKQPYTLNISESMNERIIRNCLEKINALQQQRDVLQPDYDEKRRACEDAQRELAQVRERIDVLDEEMRQQQILVEALVNFKATEADQKRIVIHAETQDEPKATRQRAPRRISWIDEASAILTEQQRFMRADEIFALVVEKPHVKEALKEMKSAKSMSTVKAVTVDNLLSHALRVSKNEWNGRFPPTFTLYNDMMGLVSWVDESHAPLDAYKAQFEKKRLTRDEVLQQRPTLLS